MTCYSTVVFNLNGVDGLVAEALNVLREICIHDLQRLVVNSSDSARKSLSSLGEVLRSHAFIQNVLLLFTRSGTRVSGAALRLCTVLLKYDRRVGSIALREDVLVRVAQALKLHPNAPPDYIWSACGVFCELYDMMGREVVCFSVSAFLPSACCSIRNYYHYYFISFSILCKNSCFCAALNFLSFGILFY